MTTSATSFEFDPSVCRLGAVKKAAYRFSAHFDVQIEAGEGAVRVTLRPRPSAPSWPCDLGSFPTEVLDQELRELVAEETKGVRDLLLAQAFSGLPLIDPTGEAADFHED